MVNRAVSASWLGTTAVLIPVKAFAEAKVRLASALGSSERSMLARAMAAHVINAAGSLPVAVVCDDAGVADWARAQGALVIWEPGRGLNGAVDSGVGQLAAAGVERVVVAHADLPLASDLGGLDRGGITLVPDRREDGTNVACVPTGSGFRFAYGPGSFARHCAEAERLGLALAIIHDATLAFDVDEPADLAGMAFTPPRHTE